MNPKRSRPQSLKAVTAVLVVVAAMAGCSSSFDGDEWAPPTPHAEEPAQPNDDAPRNDPPNYKPPIYEWPKSEPPPVPADVWRCSYSPTFNYDWHDDVVCSNGTESERPYLREWDSYVTQSEIMDSAREYETQLNRQ